ncbi:MAG TPA: N-acetylmuramoyl-L-alanine amidase [Waterburya sp.]|jgi:N-acetylmuramoyl-L-alanine amidase
MQRRIIIAAGHGNKDNGATGQGTTEAAQVIDIVNRTANKLRADGQLEVVVVPHELDLMDEINWVNARYKNIEDGYSLEIHKNAGAGGHGVEMWYYSGDAQSQAYAQSLIDKLAPISGLPNRGVKGDATNRWGRLGWIRDTNTWAGLAECGFITDGGDHLDNEKYAKGLFEGILNLWRLTPKRR